MSIHIASLVNIPCYLLKLSSGKENMGMSQTDNRSNFSSFPQYFVTCYYISILKQGPDFHFDKRGQDNEDRLLRDIHTSTSDLQNLGKN